MDCSRVWQGLTAATEVDGKRSPLECNILTTRGLVFLGEYAGIVCNVWRVYLAIRCVDIPTQNSAIIWAGSEVRWASGVGRTSHWRCGNYDGAPCWFEDSR
jgi:hypothetical protein